MKYVQDNAEYILEIGTVVLAASSLLFGLPPIFVAIPAAVVFCNYIYTCFLSMKK